MLTADDGTREGRQLDYLRQPTRYRHLDPHVFDRLNKIVRAGDRRVDAIERERVLEQAVFFGRELKGQESSRHFFFTELWQMIDRPSLVFFDPDTGVAPRTAHKGRAAAAKYIFDDEIAHGYQLGHSLVVFDHFKRVPWPTYLAEALRRLRLATGAPSGLALYSRGVAFLVFPQPDVAADLHRTAVQVAECWSPELEYTSSGSSEQEAARST